MKIFILRNSKLNRWALTCIQIHNGSVLPKQNQISVLKHSDTQLWSTKHWPMPRETHTSISCTIRIILSQSPKYSSYLYLYLSISIIHYCIINDFSPALSWYPAAQTVKCAIMQQWRRTWWLWKKSIIYKIVSKVLVPKVWKFLTEFTFAMNIEKHWYYIINCALIQYKNKRVHTYSMYIIYII